MTKNSPNRLEDNMLPEYDLSTMGRPVRGKHAARMIQEGYSVTVHNQDGTATTRYVSPEEVQQRQVQRLAQGDYVAGDKVMGDKVSGDKTMGNQITNNLQGAQIGNFANEVSDNAQQTATNFTQTNNANTTELLALLSSMRQTIPQFPQDIREEITIDLDDLETELQKPEDQRNPKRLKRSLFALFTAATMIASPIAAITDFTNNTLEIANKFHIELPVPFLK